MPDDARPTNREEQVRRLAETLRRQLGAALCDLLQQADVVELMLNADGMVWVERLGTPMRPVGRMAAATAESFIATVASTLRGAVTRDNPILECELPLGGERFEALIPPVVKAPVFAIRRKASAVFTLADYERQGIMTAVQRARIEDAVTNRRNILVVGGTGSGKTTLTNAIIDHMVEASPQHRLVIIEDTAEIQCTAENAVILRATDTIDMQRLLKATMRLRPDRIIVGEVRGGEALALLKAWNTGHPGGVCTVHANHARAGLTRVEQLIAEVSQTPMPALIGEAVDLIVAIARTATDRRIQEVVGVDGFAGGTYPGFHKRRPSMRRTESLGRRVLPVLLTIGAAMILRPDVAHAANAGGALPWDGPLTTLKNDLTGPVAFTIALLAMVAAGAALAFGGEMSHFTRSMIMVVLVAAFITGVVNVAAALGIVGAVV